MLLIAYFVLYASIGIWVTRFFVIVLSEHRATVESIYTFETLSIYMTAIVFFICTQKISLAYAFNNVFCAAKALAYCVRQKNKNKKQKFNKNSI